MGVASRATPSRSSSPACSEACSGSSRSASTRSFFDLGGDSLSATEICAQLATETGLDLPVSTLVEAPSVEALARLIGGSAALGRVSPLVPIKSTGSKPPLFLVGDLLGRVLGYAGLARHLDADQPVWGLQAMTGVESIPSLAARYLAEMRRVQPTGPYRLGGWCFGGVVAFEMAHQLRGRGEDVELLALIGISAFDFPELVSPAAWRRYQRAQGGDGLVGLVRGHLARAGAMGTTPGLRYLLERSLRVAPYVRRRLVSRAAALIGRGSGGGPGDSDVLRANRRAFARYAPCAFPGRAALLLAHDETAAYTRDPASDWRGLATTGVAVHEVPGGHDEMLAEPRVRELARLLTESLEQVAGRL